MAVTLAAFMEVLDTTIVNVSLPHIAGSMSVSYDDSTWVLTSYLVANGIVLPISGWFGNLLGRKRYFVICIVAFTVCSFLATLAMITSVRWADEPSGSWTTTKPYPRSMAGMKPLGARP